MSADWRAASDAEVEAEFVRRRWAATGGEPACLWCGLPGYRVSTRRMTFKCQGCARNFSATTNTPLRCRKADVAKYLLAADMVRHSPVGMSGESLARAVGVQPRAARYMLPRVLSAMSEGIL